MTIGQTITVKFHRCESLEYSLKKLKFDNNQFSTCDQSHCFTLQNWFTLQKSLARPKVIQPTELLAQRKQNKIKYKVPKLTIISFSVFPEVKQLQRVATWV